MTIAPIHATCLWCDTKGNPPGKPNRFHRRSGRRQCPVSSSRPKVEGPSRSPRQSVLREGASRWVGHRPFHENDQDNHIMTRGALVEPPRVMVCEVDGCNRHPVYLTTRDGRLVNACRSCMQFMLTVGWKLVLER